MDVLIIMILGVIFNFIFRKRENKIKSPVFDLGWRNVDTTLHNELDQNLEDMRVSRHIREQAFNKYKYYIDSKMTGIPRMYIGGSSFIIYTIYDEKTAKYKNRDINDEIDKEYKKLIEQFEPKE